MQLPGDGDANFRLVGLPTLLVGQPRLVDRDRGNAGADVSLFNSMLLTVPVVRAPEEVRRLAGNLARGRK